MGRGVSHKIPVIRKYVQDLSFSHISLDLGKHGISSMVRYLQHFALVMVLAFGLGYGAAWSVLSGEKTAAEGMTALQAAAS